MTTAQALQALPLVAAPARRAHLRVLRSDAAPALALRDLPARKAPEHAGAEALLWLTLAIGIHAAIVAGVWNRDKSPRLVRAPQEIELLRPAPAVPEPRRMEPPPPPKRVEPPKAVQPPRNDPPPPAALRTAPAEAPVPNTMTVAENLTAPKTSGPVAAVPTPPPAPPARVEEPVTEPTGYAGYLNNPAPVYPKAAQRLGMQGRVVLRVRVLASGQVGAIEIKQSSGKELLDEAAQSAVKSWTFAPAKRGSTPIEAWAQVPIEFKLAQ